MLIEAAGLWQNEASSKMQRLLSEAVIIVEARAQSGTPGEPRLLNNLAVLKHLEGDVAGARGISHIRHSRLLFAGLVEQRKNGLSRMCTNSVSFAL